MNMESYFSEMMELELWSPVIKTEPVNSAFFSRPRIRGKDEVAFIKGGRLTHKNLSVMSG